MPDRFAAGRAGIEGLVEKGPEGAAEGEHALTAVGPVISLSQEAGGDEAAEEPLEVQEALLAELVDARAQGGQAGAEGGEEGGVHDKYIYLSTLDVQPKISPMKTDSSPLNPAQRQYDRLRHRLAQIGYISQGSVLDRSHLQPPRSGYQWTRKVAGKTITVALSPDQFHSFKQAVENERKLWRTVQQMERLSRQILFETVPHAQRRKRLSKKVLGLI